MWLVLPRNFLLDLSRIMKTVTWLLLLQINMWFGRLLCLLDDIIDIDSAVEVHGRYVDGLYAAFFHDKNGEKIFDLISAVLQLSNDVSRLFIDLCSECDLERQKRGIGEILYITFMSMSKQVDTHPIITNDLNVEEEVRRKDVELRLTMGKSAALKVLHVKFLKTLSALRLQLLPLENEPFVGLLLRAVDLSV
uniref:NR LBD domain-containing protein n=1 Tax=Heterorhabditis bacteriophora TaxID=37862 RepID=A0A1I7XJ71_HETBA